MKTLTNYICEDFKLSHHTKLNKFNAIKPERYTGVCLALACSISNIIEKRIECFTTAYYNHKNLHKVTFKNDDMDDVFDAMVFDNYYCVYTHYWVYVLLFDDDALTFLHILLNNQEKDFDASIFTSKITKPLPVMEWKPRLQAYDFYNTSQIERMIKQIKQQNETII